MQVFDYINNLGCPKRLVARPLNGQGLYAVTIWNMANMERCGMGEATAQELKKFLRNYGYTFNEEEDSAKD